MSLITEPKIQIFKKGALDTETAKEGPDLKCTYYRFIVDASLPTSSEELTDKEALVLAEKTGTFDFLNAPDEDIYNPLDGIPI
jgi:hypothetical protein